MLEQNNPGNLEKSNNFKWLGEIDSPNVYCAFSSMELGARCLLKNLITALHEGRNTIAKIIKAYAPPSDNNPTVQYIQNVAAWSGIDGNAPIGTIDELAIIAACISRQENGASSIEAGLIKSYFANIVTEYNLHLLSQ